MIKGRLINHHLKHLSATKRGLKSDNLNYTACIIRNNKPYFKFLLKLRIIYNFCHFFNNITENIILFSHLFSFVGEISLVGFHK